VQILRRTARKRRSIKQILTLFITIHHWHDHSAIFAGWGYSLLTHQTVDQETPFRALFCLTLTCISDRNAKLMPDYYLLMFFPAWPDRWYHCARTCHSQTVYGILSLCSCSTIGLKAALALYGKL